MESPFHEWEKREIGSEAVWSLSTAKPGNGVEQVDNNFEIMFHTHVPLVCLDLSLVLLFLAKETLGMLSLPTKFLTAYFLMCLRVRLLLS
jgi:hypothetical protein